MGPSTFDIRLGDALPLTQELDDSYVDAIITSTPWPGRKGGPHPDEFVAWFLPFAIEFEARTEADWQHGVEHQGTCQGW